MAVNKLHGAEINGVAVAFVAPRAGRGPADDRRAADRASRPYRIATIPGDGVGPEVVAAARRVLDAAGDAVRLRRRVDRDPRRRRRHRRATAWPIRDEDVAACGAADAILLGAVGGPRWDDPNARGPAGAGAVRAARRPRAVRQPAAGHASTRRSPPSSPLRPELLEGVDLLIVRELTGGLYFGRPSRGSAATPGGRAARRHAAVHRARDPRASSGSRSSWPAAGRRRLTSVDKANVLATSRLWRTVVEEVRPEFPDVEVEPPARRLVRDAAGHASRPRSTSSSPRTCSATSCRTRPASSPDRSGCCRRRRSGSGGRRTARSGCTSRSTARRRTSPARTWPTRSGRSCRRRCCCAGRSAARTPPTAIEAAVARGARRRLADGRPRRRRSTRTTGSVVVGTTGLRDGRRSSRLGGGVPR